MPTVLGLSHWSTTSKYSSSNRSTTQTAKLHPQSCTFVSSNLKAQKLATKSMTQIKVSQIQTVISTRYNDMMSSQNINIKQISMELISLNRFTIIESHLIKTTWKMAEWILGTSTRNLVWTKTARWILLIHWTSIHRVKLPTASTRNPRATPPN